MTSEHHAPLLKFHAARPFQSSMGLTPSSRGTPAVGPPPSAVPRILFVDDEPAILEGLRNVLRRQRSRWEMAFVGDASSALRAMRQAPFDVVVTDMRMPVMDGAELLAQVRKERPGVVRIVLSGHAERSAVLRALGVAHQFVSKPCDPVILPQIIERTLHVQRVLADPTLRGLVGGIDKLPSPPRIDRELSTAMGREDVTVADIARILAQDPAASAKILQITSSAFFGLSRPATSIAHAVSYIGMDIVRALVMSSHLIGCVDRSLVPGLSIEAIQQASVLTARVARRLARGAISPDDAFTAGLLHDVGTLALAATCPGGMTGVYADAATRRGKPLHEVERDHLGVNHAEVGGYVLGLWGLPGALVEAVACHHAPSVCRRSSLDLAGCVHVAAALVEAHTSGRGDPCALLDIGYLEAIGLRGELPGLCRLAAEVLQAA